MESQRPFPSARSQNNLPLVLDASREKDQPLGPSSSSQSISQFSLNHLIDEVPTRAEAKEAVCIVRDLMRSRAPNSLQETNTRYNAEFRKFAIDAVNSLENHRFAEAVTSIVSQPEFVDMVKRNPAFREYMAFLPIDQIDSSPNSQPLDVYASPWNDQPLAPSESSQIINQSVLNNQIEQVPTREEAEEAVSLVQDLTAANSLAEDKEVGPLPEFWEFAVDAVTKIANKDFAKAVLSIVCQPQFVDRLKKDPAFRAYLLATCFPDQIEYTTPTEGGENPRVGGAEQPPNFFTKTKGLLQKELEWFLCWFSTKENAESFMKSACGKAFTFPDELTLEMEEILHVSLAAVFTWIVTMIKKMFLIRVGVRAHAY